LILLGPAKAKGEARSDQTGIGQDVQARRLDEQRGMADHGEPERAAFHPDVRSCRRMGTRKGRRPFRPPAAELPFEEIGETPRRLAAGIEEQGAVEMIAGRAAVIAVGGSFSRGHSVSRRLGPS
jgi:hypothetical protein